MVNDTFLSPFDGWKYLYLFIMVGISTMGWAPLTVIAGSGWDLYRLLAKSLQESLTKLSWDDNLPEKEFLSTCTSEVPPRGLHQKNKTSLHTTNCDMGTSLIFWEFLSIIQGNIHLIEQEKVKISNFFCDVTSFNFTSVVSRLLVVLIPRLSAINLLVM